MPHEIVGTEILAVAFVAIVATFVVLIALLVAIQLFLVPMSVGPRARFGDSRPFRSIRKFTGTRLEPCGCLVNRAAKRHDTVEVIHEPVYIADHPDGRTRLTKARLQLDRCTSCLTEYETAHRLGMGSETFYWPEDEMPDEPIYTEGQEAVALKPMSGSKTHRWAIER